MIGVLPPSIRSRSCIPIKTWQSCVNRVGVHDPDALQRPVWEKETRKSATLATRLASQGASRGKAPHAVDRGRWTTHKQIAWELP